jgi:hypothetical protein
MLSHGPNCDVSQDLSTLLDMNHNNTSHSAAKTLHYPHRIGDWRDDWALMAFSRCTFST